MREMEHPIWWWEFIILLWIILNTKLIVYVPDWVDEIPDNLCEKYQNGSVFMKVLFQKYQLVYDEILDETFRLDTN